MTVGHRPTMLFLCQNLPYPPDAGAHIRSFHTLRILSQRFEVSVFCFYRRAVRASARAVAAGVSGLKRYATHVEVFPIPQDGRPMRYVHDHLRSVFGGRAYTRWVYESQAFRSSLDRVLQRERFTLVHLDSLDLVAYAPGLLSLPLVCAHHNIESSLLRRRAEVATGLRRGYLKLQGRLTEKEERVWCPRMKLNVVVSQVDARRLATRSPESEIIVMPNGVDTKALSPQEGGERRGIVFVGGYTWFPNRDGMEYFAEDILPLIRRRHPNELVTWIGRAGNDVQERFARLGIRMTGYVEDIRPFMHRAACVVVPLRIGGGTRLKILDAWALGKAVVSTNIGAEGLALAEGQNILLADDPRGFAEAVCKVLESPGLRKRLEEGGRATAVDLFDWQVLAGPMLERYMKLALARSD